MIHISSTAHVFYISADDITNNNLKGVCDRIIETFENTEAISNERPIIYVFIQQPHYRWDDQVTRWMQKLEEHFEPEILFHSFIFPSEVYHKMAGKLSGDATDAR